MGYLIGTGEKPYLLFTIDNSDLLIWDTLNPIILKGTENFIVNQCTLYYKKATTPLIFAGNPEINLTDRNGVNIEYAFGGGSFSIPVDNAVRLSGGNKSSLIVDPYETILELLLECTTSVLSGDGILEVYLWGTFR
jgi:hypothetical protein